MTGSPRMIESVVTLAVLEPLKGDAGAVVSFRVPYGEVGRYRRVLVGAPEFAEGEQLVVFLQGRPPAMPTVFGLNQGVYRVSSGAGGRPMVMPPIRTEASGRIVRGDPARVPIPMAAFTREVRDIAEGSR
jgi:hypothetical protein